MKFELNQAIQILERTPNVLKTLLLGLTSDWVVNDEGENTWSPYDVVGHLIHGEKTDWISRAKLILSPSENKNFAPFDRFAQFQDSQGKTLEDLLYEFQKLREKNLEGLKKMNLNEDSLDLPGVHPHLGEVTMRQLLSTWVVHDLGHITQISRVMARQYNDEVGPWKAYLRVLDERKNG